MENEIIKLWVDDVRPAPAGFTHIASNFHSAIYLLEMYEFDVVSLDHDIGSFYGYKEMTGYDILLWLVDRKQKGLHVPADIRVHSANPVGVRNMEETIKRYLMETTDEAS